MHPAPRFRSRCEVNFWQNGTDMILLKVTGCKVILLERSIFVGQNWGPYIPDALKLQWRPISHSNIFLESRVVRLSFATTNKRLGSWGQHMQLNTDRKGRFITDRAIIAVISDWLDTDSLSSLLPSGNIWSVIFWRACGPLHQKSRHVRGPVIPSTSVIRGRLKSLIYIKYPLSNHYTL